MSLTNLKNDKSAYIEYAKSSTDYFEYAMFINKYENNHKVCDSCNNNNNTMCKECIKCKENFNMKNKIGEIKWRVELDSKLKLINVPLSNSSLEKNPICWIKNPNKNAICEHVNVENPYICERNFTIQNGFTNNNVEELKKIEKEA